MKGDFFERIFSWVLEANASFGDANAETMVIRSSRIICNIFVFFFLFFFIQEFSIDCRGLRL